MIMIVLVLSPIKTIIIWMMIIHVVVAYIVHVVVACNACIITISADSTSQIRIVPSFSADSWNRATAVAALSIP